MNVIINFSFTFMQSFYYNSLFTVIITSDSFFSFLLPSLHQCYSIITFNTRDWLLSQLRFLDVLTRQTYCNHTASYRSDFIYLFFLLNQTDMKNMI